MLQNFSMSQTFSMFQKNLENSLGHRKCLNMCFLQHKISKKQVKNDRVPMFSEKNIEKVWDIQTFCNIAKFRKIKTKK